MPAHVQIANLQLEYKWLAPSPALAPTLIFLHEGLGCVAMWKDFPERVVAATGFGALAYSRAGYGSSDPCVLPRPVRFMHDEALIVLPAVLEEFEIRETILIGHSDGASIALIYAGGIADARVKGLILLAPHVFVEDVSIESIRRTKDEYRRRDLRARLQRYHGKNVDVAFDGWNEVWLNPEFRSWNIEEYLPRIELPVLLIQGENDQYGTVAQLEAIERGVRGPVQKVLLRDCGHSPHIDQRERTLAAIKSFVQGLSLANPGGKSFA